MKLARRVISLSNITAKDIDEEACKEGSLWLDALKIYLTENMVIGITSEGGTDYEGQVAFRYEEVQRIYSYYKAARGAGSEKSGKIERYIVEAIATDGKKYTLSASKYGMYSNDLAAEMEELQKRIKEKNPRVIFEPEGVKYQTHRFSYVVETEDGEDASTAKLDESRKEDISLKQKDSG